jgi:hypothetical protein
MDTIASFDRLAAIAAYTYLRRQQGFPIKKIPRLFSLNTESNGGISEAKSFFRSTRRASYVNSSG